MANTLAGETSPYLLQHAENPVEWHPWGPEALRLARESGRPILLSVGYSACHWCHVMAHESFEDPATAAVMNEHFVNIKVDREERPDIDRIYQLAQQLLTQRSGGWPLTMFLDPTHHRPFFGGTYFPPVARYGMPGFREVLLRVAQYFREQRAALDEQGVALMQALASMDPPELPDGSTLEATPLRASREVLERQFDREYGGHSGAPKFPHPTTIERLMRDWHASAHRPDPDLQALYMATLTLTRMAEGGLFDHLAGGFCRYSVDAEWDIPHFEKMLYDNGALLANYAAAALATGEAFFARTARETAAWMLEDMQSPSGGFWSSRDADSEGHEGKYYVWDRAEVAAILGPAEYAAFAPRYGLDGPPNFEGEWHLRLRAPLPDPSQAEAQALIEASRRKLLAARAKRVPPQRDEKILTSWNALAIRGLAIAARSLDEPDLAAAATRALDFLRRELHVDGRLLATHKDGRSHLDAYLDDHALLIDAVLELQQLRWSGEELAFAMSLAEALLSRFEDRERGGFYFTSHDHEQLIVRTRSFGDEATPSGNGIAAQALQRLGWLLAEPRYLEAAERTLRAGASVVARYPHGHASMLAALEDFLDPPPVVVLRGPAAGVEAWRLALGRHYDPRRLVLAIPAGAGPLPAALASKPALAAPCAYVCRGLSCGQPITSLEELLALNS